MPRDVADMMAARGFDFAGEAGQTPMTQFRPEEDEIYKKYLISRPVDKFAVMSPSTVPVQMVGFDETATVWPDEATGKYVPMGLDWQSMSPEEKVTTANMMGMSNLKKFVNRAQVGAQVDESERKARMEQLHREALRRAMGNR